MIKWINADIEPIFDSSDDHYASPTFLITDGKSISVGWYEPEYIAESPNDPTQYSSAVWHDDAHLLTTDYGGWPMVTHYAELPELPKEEEST